MASSSLAFIVFLTFSYLCPTNSQSSGFSVELIHRDHSPKSPFYNPEENAYQRMAKAFQRSIPNSLVYPNDAQSEIIPNGGAYLMNITLGTPPVPILSVADTGSSLIWTQCQPCENCYEQEAPLFDPRLSSTYEDISCTSNKCKGVKTMCGLQDICQYSILYGDKSFSQGTLATETVGLASSSGSAVSLPETVIGCGHNNDGKFTTKISGITGLGRGSLSLVSQMGESIAGKFSYCLIPSLLMPEKSSILNFGTKAVVKGPGVVSTPMWKQDNGEFYYLTLEAISVGSRKVQFGGPSSSQGDGNIIIDSGTTLTLLPTTFYSEFVKVVASEIDVEPIQVPTDGIKPLCYSSSSLTIPPMTMHFKGADLKLQSLNTFRKVAEDVSCLAFVESKTAIYGNVAQINFLVGYDLESQTVSFMPTDCTKM